MFTTFDSTNHPTAGSSTSDTPPKRSPVPQSRPKRNQVSKACDWCRIHRVRCDNEFPCSNCKSRGRQCNGVGKVSTLPQAYREMERLKKRIEDLETEIGNVKSKSKAEVEAQKLQTVPHDDAFASDSRHTEPAVAGKRSGDGIHISTGRSTQKTWFGPSSLFDFMGRMNAFLGTALEQARQPNRMLPDSASQLLDVPAHANEINQDRERRPVAIQSEVDARSDFLTPTQEEYFLGLFWQSYHPIYPILDETEFKEHYQSLWLTSNTGRKPSALVDIVLALCMQHGMALLPNVGRAASPASRANVDTDDATIAGRWYYRRCQTLLTSELETPTISTLQCHILCSLYLHCASFHNMADNACGIASRTAYMLGLHLEPSLGMPLREREMRKRLWWTLYTLESKMSMKLGRPFLLYGFNTTCSFPDDRHEVASLSGSSFAPIGSNATWLTWTNCNTKLVLAARVTHVAFHDQEPSTSTAATNTEVTTVNDDRITEAHAEFLTSHMSKLEQWAQSVPEALRTKRQNTTAPFSTDCAPLTIEQFEPIWLQRQRFLLELEYHNLCANLYRPFISFLKPTGPTPVADSIAIKCADHAIALSQTMHQVVSTTSILAGWHEAFQWQWNAAMTLIGFMLAYPQDNMIHAARSAIELSIFVFDTFGHSFATAASAANIVRELSVIVDLRAEQANHNVQMIMKETNVIQVEQVSANKTTQMTSIETTDVMTSASHAAAGPQQTMEGFEGADDGTATALQGILAQSIDSMLGMETYNSFGSDLEAYMSNMNGSTSNPWPFQ